MRNRYVDEGSTITIIVRHKDMDYFVAISRGSFDRVDKYDVWYITRMRNGKMYVMTRADGKTVYLHRVVTGAPDGLEVDHIDGDALNNRDDNLRVVTRAVSMNNRPAHRHNKCGVRGVCWVEKNKAWKAHYRGKCVGFYPTLEAASIAVKEHRERLLA